MGRFVRGGPHPPSLRGAGVARASRGAGPGVLSVVARGGAGPVIRKHTLRWQSAAERARVAAELIEEAQSLTETAAIATPAELERARLPPPIAVTLPGQRPVATALPPALP